ncbi:FG-GAP repeat protein [Streptomyces sp. P38-E01]|uniref:FG-GAP repeat protein n=1 Tax=Streptomyces tardus TaxID=2780544 RepID=A0A949JD12_9ACTN|nr:FG-GAP-like repeat-containing protein [Streptomyces tardus]MBU7597818.1 FG-GAP repeat protein [Streptomyces tardus]
MEQPPTSTTHGRSRRARVRRTAALSTGVATALAAAILVPTFASAGSEDDSKPKEPQGPAVKEDFNGDGFQDMAVGAPGSPSEDSGNAGYVTVFYGTPDGLDRDNAVTVSQATDGVPGDPAPHNHFGQKVAGADLDQDGYTDLAVHVPGARQVIVLWGGKTGINGKGSSVIEADEDFGSVGSRLTAGDFNGDGSPDLLMTRGHERGTYGVLQGPFTRDGEWADEQQVQLTTGDSEATDILSVTAGDVTGDGADDLVVHQVFEEMSLENLFFTGGKDGLTRAEDVSLPHAAAGAIGDFDGDGHGDLAYREVPGNLIENLPYDEGTVKVVYGTSDGLGNREQTFTQGTPGVPGTPEEGDQFGAGLSAGDVTGDGVDDLAVAVPFEEVNGQDAAGGFVLLKGSESNGLSGSGAQAFHQDTPGIAGVAEANDLFGGSVRLLDVNGDGKADITAGAPGEAIGDVADTGAIWYVPGAADGLTAEGSNAVNPGEIDAELPGVRFGTTLTNSGYAPLPAR